MMLPSAPAIADTLRSQLLFSRLSDDQLARVACTAAVIHLSEGEGLFRQGDAARRFYLVLEGLIKLSRLSPGGNEKIIEIVAPGQTFAEALMFLDRPYYPVNATALEASELVSIDSREFASVLRESTDTCFLIMGDMSQRLRGLVQEIDELTLQSATCRVASYLLNQTREKEGTLVLDLPKQVLAARLSVTPETFSRILRRLSNQGLIQVDRDVVRIRDRPSLSRSAEHYLPRE